MSIGESVHALYNLAEENKELRAEIARLQAALAQKDEEITALEGQIKSDAAIMAENDAMIAALTAKLEAAQAALRQIATKVEGRGYFLVEGDYVIDGDTLKCKASEDKARVLAQYEAVRAAHEAGKEKP